MTSPADAAACLRAGGIIAHATEGVWGLACDPNNELAVQRILAIKGRDADKGLLLIGAASAAFAGALEQMPSKLVRRVEASWPGHVTWLLPGSEYPSSIKGQHATIACRVPDHEQARQICAAFGGPLVSTSLNRAGDAPLTEHVRAVEMFGDLVDLVVPGETAGYLGPSAIYGLDGTVIRAASVEAPRHG